MAEVYTKRFYHNEDIETLPREKLLECIDCLFYELESSRNTARSIIELNKLRRDVHERERQQARNKKHLFPETIKG